LRKKQDELSEEVRASFKPTGPGSLPQDEINEVTGRLTKMGKELEKADLAHGGKA
jgi:hypothetical protein